jgi:ubiquinone biosynthesis UbiH/UbiF/VisC/COQ6 family hydroxylase
MVGASAALMLARKGYTVALVEKQALPQAQHGHAEITLSEAFDVRVSAISPASQQLLQELGVWKDVTGLRSCDYHKMTVWHENGTAQMQFASEQIGRSHLGTIVENGLLQALLIRHLAHMPNVRFFAQQEVVAIQQNEQSVKLTTSVSSSLVADLLIAADGRHSSARQLLHLPAMGGSYHQTAIVANVNTQKSHQNTAWQRFLETGPLAFLPLSNGQSSIVWSVDTARAQELLGLEDEEFRLQLEQAFESRLGQIVSTSVRAGFPLNWHSAERWLELRVLLIGDAAHGVHPLAGQGVNLGFGDVALLSRKFNTGDALYQRRRLRQFERQRKAETVSATHLFSALKMVYGQRAPWLCKARDAGMSLVNRNAMIRRLVLQSAVQNMV